MSLLWLGLTSWPPVVSPRPRNSPANQRVR